MESVSLCIFFGLLVLVSSQDCNFRLNGSQHLKFEFDDLDLSKKTDFILRFKTSQADTLLYHVEGRRREGIPLDYEGLYIREGKLNYFMFNPSEFGAGSSHGGHVQTDFTVNNDTVIEVEFFRNKRVAQRGGGSDTIDSTGMRISGGSLSRPEEVRAMGAIPEMDLFSSPGKVVVYIGGLPDISRVSKHLHNFDGEISGLKDMQSNTFFGSPHTTSSYVSNSCERTPA